MTLLVMDTVGPELMVGLFGAESQLIAQHTHASDDQRHHSATLIPTLKQLLSESNLLPTDLTGLVVNVGPGSFTGIRTVLTSAKILAEHADIPIVPVTTLQLWVMAAQCSQPLVAEQPITTLLDARRGRAYVGRYLAPKQPGNLPDLDAPITCQPVSETLLAPGKFIIASPSLHSLLSQQTDNLQVQSPPSFTTPQLIQQWCSTCQITPATFLRNHGQPWETINPVYGQAPNITLPKKT